MANPDFDRVFAEGGTKDTIVDADYDGGWDDIAGALPPTKAEFNAIDNEQDVKLKWLYERMGRAIPATGTDTYTAAGIVDQLDGQTYTVIFENTNTGAATVNGVDIRLSDGSALLSASIVAGEAVELIYDLANDYFVLIRLLTEFVYNQLNKDYASSRVWAAGSMTTGGGTIGDLQNLFSTSNPSTGVYRVVVVFPASNVNNISCFISNRGSNTSTASGRVYKAAPITAQVIEIVCQRADTGALTGDSFDFILFDRGA
jgi:hypothetical protein